MHLFTLDELKTYLRAAVGDDESVDLDGDVLDVTFADLGFDSLAMIDTVSKIELRYRVSLPEDATGAATPRELLGMVQPVIAGRAAA